MSRGGFSRPFTDVLVTQFRSVSWRMAAFLNLLLCNGARAERPEIPQESRRSEQPFGKLRAMSEVQPRALRYMLVATNARQGQRLSIDAGSCRRPCIAKRPVRP